MTGHVKKPHGSTKVKLVHVSVEVRIASGNNVFQSRQRRGGVPTKDLKVLSCYSEHNRGCL